jgi:hypothetical protein
VIAHEGVEWTRTCGIIEAGVIGFEDEERISAGIKACLIVLKAE